MNLLSVAVVFPMIAAIIISVANKDWAKKIALSAAIIELLITLQVVRIFNHDDGGFQLVQFYTWIPSINCQFLIGVDGISVIFLPMTALLILLSIITSWHIPTTLIRLYWVLLLILEAAIIGIFSALDLILFFFFWELILLPIFFLMGLWGGIRRSGAAIKYILLMLFGNVPLLVAFTILAINHVSQINGNLPQDLSFSLPVLLETPLSEQLQTIVFFLMLVGFAIRVPLIPLHSSLLSSVISMPATITSLLVGLNLGIYGIIRFVIPLAPSAAVENNWILAIWGAITLIYAGLIMLQQTNLRRLLVFASISHSGLVIMGIAALNMQGIQGALFQLFNFTLAISALLLIAGFIQQRLGSTEQQHLGGLIINMPRLTTFHFIFILTIAGIPGSSGFPAQLLVIMGALLGHPSLGLTALAGILLNTANLLVYSRRTFLGPIKRTSVSQTQDLRPRELTVLSILALLIIVFGFWPNGFLTLNKKTAETWLARLLDQPTLEGEELVQLN